MTWRRVGLWAACVAVGVGVALAAAGARVASADAYVLLILTNFVIWSAVRVGAERTP